MKRRIEFVLLLAGMMLLYLVTLSSWSTKNMDDMSSMETQWAQRVEQQQQTLVEKEKKKKEMDFDDDAASDVHDIKQHQQPLGTVPPDELDTNEKDCGTTNCSSNATINYNITLPPLTSVAPPLAPQPRKANAVIVILCRNSELDGMRRTIREFEDRFNRRFKYPYVFLNDEPFEDDFKQSILAMTENTVEFGLVPDHMWSIPDWVDGELVEQCLLDYQMRGVLYGGSLSYRHMCRFNSGWFYRHPLIAKYDYYWRVEPSVHFFCDLLYDPFLYMQDNGKEYGFTITLKELPETIPSLWKHTIEFAKEKKLNTTLLRFFADDQDEYNLCHYWSNFEIASLKLWRDPMYQAYFDYLDETGNFFYERWGDAIVHSLAAGMFLNKSQVHFFDDIGYQHDNFAHCTDDGVLGTCLCPEDVENFDTNPGSCLDAWKDYPDKGVKWNFRPDSRSKKPHKFSNVQKAPGTETDDDDEDEDTTIRSLPESSK
ncbi:glycolipid 2-alpha-mannosyltransferase-domain-containing protein [Gongronella butleri]|nr:glycolipid 2-alpha-mannosyltransferase-domain-containing protein [Gongronella butleri]